MRPNEPKVKKEVRLAFLFVLAAASTLAVGCVQLPSQPIAGAVETTAEVSVTQNGLLGGVTGLLKGLLTVTLNLVGGTGGSVINDKWRVVIPPGAVEGNATVGMGVDKSARSDVQLEILPIEKNHFLVPATLTFDCTGVSSSDLRNYTIYWYNPATRAWVEVPGSKVDLAKKTVSAPLSHFSQYSAGPKGGKAGW